MSPTRTFLVALQGPDELLGSRNRDDCSSYSDTAHSRDQGAVLRRAPVERWSRSAEEKHRGHQSLSAGLAGVPIDLGFEGDKVRSSQKRFLLQILSFITYN